jgi:sulfotransferase
MKTINFVSGWYRSGSTLLTVLLNQHPEIYASHQSDLNNVLDLVQSNLGTLESFSAGNATHRYYQMLANMPQAYYQDIEKPFVFDKNRGWGHPDSFKYMNMINKDYKILYTYRPVLEVLASIVVIHRNNPKNIFMQAAKKHNYPSLSYREEEDALCDHFMEFSFERLIAIYAVLKRDYKDNVVLINYADLIKDTQSIMDNIYSSIGASPFTNDLSNIKDAEEPDDTYFGAELHKVSSSITKSRTSYEDILSPYVIQRYGHLLDIL